MTKKEIRFFLRYGYFPGYEPLFTPERVNKINLENKSYKDLKKDFYIIFSKVIEKNLKNIPKDKKIIIPISGGLDSRAILAGVLEFVPKSRIRTYTFGIKGSYDFEIGKEVAKKAGVHHDAIELNSLRFTQEEMIEVAKRCDFQTNLFHHPPLKVLEDLIDGGVVFSGYLGDLIFGSYADKNDIKENEVESWYIKNKYYSNYFNGEENFKNYLQTIDNKSIVPPIEQLILYERGPKLTAPHILMKGWDYKVPLIDKSILDFMYSIPNKFRLEEKLFIDTMLEFYPALFNIKSKTTFGYHLKAPKVLLYYERIKNKVINVLNNNGCDLVYPPFNYIDFNKEILERKDLVKIFTTNLKDLEERNILEDIKPTEIYEEHKKTKNLYDVLIVLTSLEIILKAKEQ